MSDIRNLLSVFPFQRIPLIICGHCPGVNTRGSILVSICFILDFNEVRCSQTALAGNESSICLFKIL